MKYLKPIPKFSFLERLSVMFLDYVNSAVDYGLLICCKFLYRCCGLMISLIDCNSFLNIYFLVLFVEVVAL